MLRSVKGFQFGKKSSLDFVVPVRNMGSNIDNKKQTFSLRHRPSGVA